MADLKEIFKGFICMLAWCGMFATPIGCTVFENQDKPDKPPESVTIERPQPRPESEFTSMLSYYHWIKQCTSGELYLEYQRVARGRTPDDALRDRLRLALLLTLPHEPFTDELRAKTLLQGYLKSGGTHREDDVGFAMLLLEVIHERERHSAAVDNLKQQIASYSSLKNELDRERQLRRELQSRVEQLKAIEESINKREKTVIVPLEQEKGDVKESQDTPRR
jgi:hypothetical protein